MSSSLSSLSGLSSQDDQVESWAAGKLILFGEHSVVYGYPAVACSLDRGLYARLKKDTVHQASRPSPLPSSLPSLLIKGVEGEVYPSADGSTLERAFETAWCCIERSMDRATHLDRPPSQIEVGGPLPFKVGLGSSAAFSIVLLRILSKVMRHPLSDDELSDGALELERIFHHTPSGVDHTVSIMGGVIIFQREPDHSLSVEPIISPHPLPLVVSWTPREGSTADAVNMVRRLRETDPVKTTHILEAMGEITRQGIKSLRDGDLNSIGRLFQESHQELCALGVSTASLEHLRTLHLNAGAIGVKLTGAGFGGAVVALYPSVQAQREGVTTLQTLGETAWPHLLRCD